MYSRRKERSKEKAREAEEKEVKAEHNYKPLIDSPIKGNLELKKKRVEEKKKKKEGGSVSRLKIEEVQCGISLTNFICILLFLFVVLSLLYTVSNYQKPPLDYKTEREIWKRKFLKEKFFSSFFKSNWSLSLFTL